MNLHPYLHTYIFVFKKWSRHLNNMSDGCRGCMDFEVYVKEDCEWVEGALMGWFFVIVMMAELKS